MPFFAKSKNNDMQRLRAAGFSLANADRMSQDRRSGAVLILGAGAVGLLLVGAIAVLGLQTSDEPRRVARVEEPAATPQMLPLETAVNASLRQAEIDRIEAAAVRAALVQVTTATQPAAQTTLPQTASVTPEASTDCVAELDSYLEPHFVQFGIGSSLINDASDAKLATISEEIADCDDAYIMVSGHSDSTGDDAVNIALSWERADRTVARLASYGVDATALEAIGFGARSPISQGSASDDPENRRVEFRVLRKKDPVQ